LDTHSYMYAYITPFCTRPSQHMLFMDVRISDIHIIHNTPSFSFM